ncbi:lipase family protein [Blastomonas sp.]|uniref:lipase family protein n=1 Tax=Blastomonas sp. TaxID=1909299 RepID=UPI003918A5EC
MPDDSGASPFYRWQADIPSPGRLLRSEPIGRAQLPSRAGSGQRMLYSSSSDFGTERAIAASGAVYFPKGKPPRGGWRVMVWAHGTKGVADVCAPSFAGLDTAESGFVDRWLKRGYAVVAPDYEGLGTPGPHPYMGLGSAARTTLDAARALADDQRLADELVIAGHSQGAHAAFGAGLIQPHYAPDVHLRAVLVAGLPGEAGFAHEDAASSRSASPLAVPLDPQTPRDSVRSLRAEGFDPWIAVYLNYVSSYALAFPGFRAEHWLTADGLKIADELSKACASPTLAAFMASRRPASDLMKRDLSDIERGAARFRRYPAPHFSMPVLLVIARHDALTAPELSFNMARAACARDSAITVRYVERGSHADARAELGRSGPDFADAVLADSPMPGDCASLAWPGRG